MGLFDYFKREWRRIRQKRWSEKSAPALSISQQTLLRYQDAGIERYMFCALLDYKTRPVCGALDRKVFAVRDAHLGKNLPPLHDGCRCSISPEMTRGELKGITRSAQTMPDSWEPIPGDITWAQWRKKYVEGNENAFDHADDLAKRRYSYSANQDDVLRVIGVHPGILQKDLPDYLPEFPKHVVIANLKGLVLSGKVTKVRSGNTFALYINR